MTAGAGGQPTVRVVSDASSHVKGPSLANRVLPLPSPALLFLPSRHILLNTKTVGTGVCSVPRLRADPAAMERIRVSKVALELHDSRTRTHYTRSRMCTSTAEAFGSTARCTSCPTTSSSATCPALRQMHRQTRDHRARKKYGLPIR
jgi:hypothetical protein